MLPLQTANNMYNYENEYQFKSNKKDLITLVKELHIFNTEQLGWKSYNIKIGCFGFDCLALSICYALDAIPKIEKVTVDKVANVIHKAWSDNYIFWRDNKPWLNKHYSYQKPSKAFGDTRRNNLAKTKYIDLPDEEKEKSRILARYIMDNFV